MIASPLLMGLVLLIDPRAKNVEWSGGVAVELRGGHAPLVPGQPSEPAMRLSIAPRAAMLFRSRVRNQELWLEYTPQAFMRISELYLETAQVKRPLTFHQLRARYLGDINRSLSWQGVLGASVGELDYSLQSAQLGQDPSAGADGSDDAPVDGGSQGQLLDDPILLTGGASGAFGLNVRPHPLHRLTIQPSATVRRLLSDAEGVDGIFDQRSADLSLTHGFVASRVDSISATATGGYVDFGSRGSQAYAAGSFGWLRRLRARLDGQLTAGVFFTEQVREGNTVSAAGGAPLFPTVDYYLSGRLLQRSRLRINANINAGNRAYFDAVEGGVKPLTGGGLGLSFIHPPDLTVGLMASFYTPPIAAEMESPATGRTSLSVQVPVVFQISRNYSLEVGALFTGRGPHRSRAGDNGAFPQTEAWLYVTFRALYST